MKKMIAFTLAAICLSGCISTTEIVVDSVKSWEGHYKTAEEFREKTKDIQLEQNETIWVLSNKTLSRVLKNVEKKQP